MWCIICHNETIGLEVLVVHIRCKGLIAYHKSNGIIAMKKHVDIEHGALLKRYVEEVNNYFKPSLQHELAIKHPHFTPIAIFRFFFLYKPIYKRPWDPICFLGRWKVICNKRFFCQWEQLNPFGYTEWLIGHAQSLFFIK